MRLTMMTLCLLMCSTALAGEHEDEPAQEHVCSACPALNVGGFGVVIPGGGWGGEFLYAGPSVFITMGERFAFIPMVAVQVAPVSGYWGVSGTMMLELIPPKGPVAIDLIPTMGTETTPEAHSSVWWAIGPGLTLELPNHLMLGAGLQVGGVIGHEDLLFSPLLNIAAPIGT